MESRLAASGRHALVPLVFSAEPRSQTVGTVLRALKGRSVHHNAKHERRSLLSISCKTLILRHNIISFTVLMLLQYFILYIEVYIVVYIYIYSIYKYIYSILFYIHKIAA